MTVKKVKKYYPETDETPKGHMRQVQQGICSTKERGSVPKDNDGKVSRRKQHDIYVRVDQVKDTIYTDQTGKFPITYSRGHKYIIIM